MLFAGVDLHKKTITVVVVDQARRPIGRKRLYCCSPESIRDYFAGLGKKCSVVVEATASYEWFVDLIETVVGRVVLAHPAKLRVIAESTRKTDRLDATVLAEFLALDMIPAAYRPTVRQRQHRILVRQRVYLQRQITAIKNKLRRILSDYNADRSDLFTAAGAAHLEEIALRAADRFCVDQLREQLKLYGDQLRQANRQLQEFAEKAPAREAEARELLLSIPGVGPVTTDVVLAELADVQRFASQKKAVAYAGLAPGRRESDGKRQDLHIEKTGSRLLRWALVEASWHLVRRTARWRNVFENLARRTGKKKAIVAVARRLLCLMVAVLKSGQPYRHAEETRPTTSPPQEAPPPTKKQAARQPAKEESGSKKPGSRKPENKEPGEKRAASRQRPATLPRRKKDLQGAC